MYILRAVYQTFPCSYSWRNYWSITDHHIFRVLSRVGFFYRSVGHIPFCNLKNKLRIKKQGHLRLSQVLFCLILRALEVYSLGGIFGLYLGNSLQAPSLSNA